MAFSRNSGGWVVLLLMAIAIWVMSSWPVKHPPASINPPREAMEYQRQRTEAARLYRTQ